MLTENIRIALRGLAANKMRATLTMLGIMIGVAAVITLLSIGAFLAGCFTVGQFSFWGNYLPRVYPLHLRGTGEGFAANIGGRMIGTSFAAVTSLISTRAFSSDVPAPLAVAYTAAGVALFVYLAGTILCFWLPEPREELPE